MKKNIYILFHLLQLCFSSMRMTCRVRELKLLLQKACIRYNISLRATSNPTCIRKLHTIQQLFLEPHQQTAIHKLQRRKSCCRLICLNVTSRQKPQALQQSCKIYAQSNDPLAQCHPKLLKGTAEKS